MTLQQMRYFIAVAQNLSFSKAAQQHYVSQTAVSQQIKLLEEELETELFQRTRHSVALTSAGQVFYEYAVRSGISSSCRAKSSFFCCRRFFRVGKSPR